MPELADLVAEVENAPDDARRVTARNALALAVRAALVTELRKLRTPPDMRDDLAQGQTLRLVAHFLAPTKQISNLDAYLKVSARNALTNLWRSESRRERGMSQDVLERTVAAPAGPVVDEEHDAREELLAALHEAFTDPCMPSQYREVLRVCYLDEPPTPIAELALREIERRKHEAPHLAADFAKVRNSIDARLTRARAWVRDRATRAKP